jgi:hypothetical protein
MNCLFKNQKLYGNGRKIKSQIVYKILLLKNRINLGVDGSILIEARKRALSWKD